MLGSRREKFLREGFDDYLSKPIDIGELESILERHLPAEIVSFDIEYPRTTTADKPAKAVDKPANASQTSSALIESTSAQAAFSGTEADDDNLNRISRKNFFAVDADVENRGEKISTTADKPVKASDEPANASQTSSALIESTSAQTAFSGTEADADIFNEIDRKIFTDACPDINLDTTLHYCMDSKSFAIQMLITFTDAARAEKIQAAFDSGDVKNYQILVHALKSTSLSIGAENLSNQARKLELAAKADDLAAIQAGHALLMAAYRNVREQIAHWMEASA